MSDESLMSLKSNGHGRYIFKNFKGYPWDSLWYVWTKLATNRYKSTEQALYQEIRKAYPDNPKAWNDACDAFVAFNVKPAKWINFES